MAPLLLEIGLERERHCWPIGSAKAMSESSRVGAEALFASLNNVPQ
jgi:hypothetical protein